MLLLWLLLLLPLLAMLWQQRPSWLILLRHQVAWRVLAWEAAWQQRKLEQSTLRTGQSQQQALTWCLKRAQSPCCLPRGITGAVLTQRERAHQSLEPKGPVHLLPILCGLTRASPQLTSDSPVTMDFPLLGPVLALAPLSRPFLGSFLEGLHILLTS